MRWRVWFDRLIVLLVLLCAGLRCHCDALLMWLTMMLMTRVDFSFWSGQLYQRMRRCATDRALPLPNGLQKRYVGFPAVRASNWSLVRLR